MGRNRLPNQFGKINDRVFKNMSSKQRQPIAIYNNSFKQLEGIEDEMDSYDIIISELKEKKEKVKKRLEKIYTENKHLLEEYYLKYNISTNSKKLKSGIKIYWMMNVKFKGMTKPIYIGNDEFVRDYLSKNKKLHKELKDSDIDFNNLSKDDIRYCLQWVIDTKEVLDKKVAKGENILSQNILFTDLI